MNALPRSGATLKLTLIEKRTSSAPFRRVRSHPFLGDLIFVYGEAIDVRTPRRECRCRSNIKKVAPDPGCRTCRDFHGEAAWARFFSCTERCRQDAIFRDGEKGPGESFSALRSARITDDRARYFVLPIGVCEQACP